MQVNPECPHCGAENVGPFWFRCDTKRNSPDERGNLCYERQLSALRQEVGRLGAYIVTLDSEHIDAVESLKQQAGKLREALISLYKWVKEGRDSERIHWLNDHACEKCVPWSESFKPGFVCSYHIGEQLAESEEALRP